MDFCCKTVVNKNIKDVFEFYKNTDKLPWDTADAVISQQKLTEGEVRKGTKYKEVIKIGSKREMTVKFEIVYIQEPTAVYYMWETKRMEGLLEYSLTDMQGQTEIEQYQTLKLHGIFNIAAPVVYYFFKKKTDCRLQGIKKMLDSCCEMDKNLSCMSV